jgi:GMP synthase-like glutamine amidotransferase
LKPPPRAKRTAGLCYKEKKEVALRTIIIDNSVLPLYLREGRITARHLPEDVRWISGVNDKLPTLLDFDRLIVTGSEASACDNDDWIKRQTDLLAYAALAGKAILGICFGHQLIARAMGGDACVGRTDHPEFGWLDIRLDVDEPLFEGLPHHTKWLCSHFDHVPMTPPGARVLAQSDHCDNHAFRLVDRPVWGLQFHPEYYGLNAFLVLSLILARNRGLTIPTAGRPTSAEAATHARRLFANFWRLTA